MDATIGGVFSSTVFIHMRRVRSILFLPFGSFDLQRREVNALFYSPVDPQLRSPHAEPVLTVPLRT